MRSRKLPLLTSLLTIFLSTLFVSGSATAGWVYYRRWQQQRCQDPTFLVCRISQDGPLPADLLAQLMQLTPHHNLYALDTQVLEQRLTVSPLIASARITRALPDTLAVDYTPCQPVARLAEFPAYGLDAEGNVLALSFWSGGHLPEVYLGAPSLDALPEQPLSAALSLIDTTANVQRIDTAQVLAESSGRRQIVLIVGLPPNRHILRIHPRHIDEALSKYKRLQPPPGNLVIDLRLRQLAYISEDTP